MRGLHDALPIFAEALQEEAMIGGIIADGGGMSTPLVAEAEEDVDAGPDRAGYGGLGATVRDGLCGPC